MKTQLEVISSYRLNPDASVRHRKAWLPFGAAVIAMALMVAVSSCENGAARSISTPRATAASTPPQPKSTRAVRGETQHSIATPDSSRATRSAMPEAPKPSLTRPEQKAYEYYTGPAGVKAAAILLGCAAVAEVKKSERDAVTEGVGLSVETWDRYTGQRAEAADLYDAAVVALRQPYGPSMYGAFNAALAKHGCTLPHPTPG